jgi:hypothetical protein
MAALTVYTIDYDGVDVESAYAAHIKNTSGGSITCTLTTAGTYQSHAIADTVITVGATTGEQMVGPFKKDIYNANDGNIDITWSATAGVTIGVFKLP